MHSNGYPWQIRNAVKSIRVCTSKWYSSHRITRIPFEEDAPLRFKLIDEKLLELHDLESAGRSRILDTYEAIGDSQVRKVLDGAYYNRLLKQTSNLALALIPEDYAKIFDTLRKFPTLTPEYVQSLNLAVQRLSKNFTTAQIALLMRSYAKIRSRSVKTITGLLETLNKKFDECEAWELREVAAALASLNIPNDGPAGEFYSKTAAALPKHLKAMDANDIAIFVNAFARQGVSQGEVLHYVEMNHKRIVNSVTPKNLALILNAFARNNRTADGLMQAVSNKLSGMQSAEEREFQATLNVIDVALIFNSFVKLEHFDQKLFNLYIPWLLERLDKETPTLSLVLLAHAYSQSGIGSRDLFSKMAHLLVYTVSQLNPQKLGLVSLSYAKIGYAPPLLFHRIADEVIYRGTIGLKYSRYEFDLQSLEQLTQAFSRVCFRDRRIFAVLTTLLKSRYRSNRDEMTGEMVASLMLSLSRNQTEGFAPFIHDVLEKAQDSTAFSTVALSKVLTAFHKLGLKNARLTARFLKETSDRVNQFSPPVLINTFKALAKLGCYEGHLVKETIKRCSLHLANLSTIDLSNLVYALAEFSYRNVTFLKKLSVCINYRMQELSKQQVHVIFTRLALLRVSDLELMLRLLDRVSALQHEFNEAETAEIVVSIVYVLTHFEGLNREIARTNGDEGAFYGIPDSFYSVLGHLLSLLGNKLDVATIFKLKTVGLYLKNMKPERYRALPPKSREILEKAEAVQFSLAEYILTSSGVHKEISHYLNLIGVMHRNEVQFGPYLIDLVPECAQKVAVEYDGPSHFYVETVMRNIKSILKHEILSSCGWRMIHIPYQEWAQLVNEKQKIIYLNKIRGEIMGTGSG